MYPFCWKFIIFLFVLLLFGVLGSQCSPDPSGVPKQEFRGEWKGRFELRPEPSRESVRNLADASEWAIEPPVQNREAVNPGRREAIQEPAFEGVQGDPDGSSGEVLPESRPESKQEVTPEQASNDCSQSIRYTFGKDTVVVSCQPLSMKVQGVSLRSYTMRTTHALRDNLPSSKQITFKEDAAYPFLRSSSLLLDALFAMAVYEAKLNSVSQVKEFAFQKGKPVPCRCFQTGEKWTWAWTRDTAYAIDLSLGWFDPQRSMETLLFKISERKNGGSSQLVQDTGSGGSWPVSTDRVTWAIAAGRLLPLLTSKQRQIFLQKAWPALKNTIEHDRKWIFDRSDGLYRGEQSFLDWREQSYPSWIPNALSVMAMSKALSTNVNHLAALETAVQMAQEQGLLADKKRFQGWIDALRKAIVQELLSTENKWFNTLKLMLPASLVTERSDLLGNALAVLWKVGTEQQRSGAVDAYPHSSVGTPVLWPQQPFVPIYHNRAIWPFVSAYGALAAQATGNSKIVDHTLKSLVRASALNLSHMENLEWLSGNNFVSDGQYSGPVVNSRRQLWSVAGFLGVFLRGVFGVQTTMKGTRFAPMLPMATIQRWLKRDKASLYNLSWHGKKLRLHLEWPTSTRKDGAMVLNKLVVNGQVSPQNQFWQPDFLKADNTVALSLVWKKTRENLRIVNNSGNYRSVFSPKEPAITQLRKSSRGLELTLSANGEKGVRFLVYREGKRVATVTGTTWVDTGISSLANTTPCYNLVAQFTDTRHMSHPSYTRCYDPVGEGREQWLEAWQFKTQGGRWKWQGATLWLENWGEAGRPLRIGPFQPNRSGKVHLAVRFQNSSGPVNTGITCASKQVDVFEVGRTQPVASGRWVMPHTVSGKASYSNEIIATLDSSKRYFIALKEPASPSNMSYFSHFTNYTGGVGGGNSSHNRVSLEAVRLRFLTGKDERPATGKLVSFNGTNDLNKLKSTQIVTPGVTLKAWERFGLTWDKDWLYIAVVSEAFSQPLKAFFLYLQTSKGALPTALSGRGMTYLSQQSYLPFKPTFAIGVREKSDNLDGFGPWNGIWSQSSTGWTLERRLKPGRDYFVAGDKHTISFRVPRALIGDPTQLRLTGHVVYAVGGQEWKVTVPATHTPWKAHNTGYYQIDLSKTPNVTNWSAK